MVSAFAIGTRSLFETVSFDCDPAGESSYSKPARSKNWGKCRSQVPARDAASIEQNAGKSLKFVFLSYPCKAQLQGPNRLVREVWQ